MRPATPCPVPSKKRQTFIPTRAKRGTFGAPFHCQSRNSRFAGLLPDSEVIQRVETAESPAKHAFRGVCPPPDPTISQPRHGRNQPPLNHFPNHPTTAFQPRPNHRKPQPLHNRPSAARRTIPRLAKTHDSTILRVESKNDSDSTIPHPRSLNRQHRAAWPWLVY